jgi:3-oxoacyl-[acyl-carrier protein] reductase
MKHGEVVMVDLVNELAGKVAIVTGSARNIGRTTALELARAGADIVVNARTSKELCEEVAHEIERLGRRALPIVADITDADAVARLVETTKAELGGVDILINNAAFRSRVPFVELDDETWDFTLAASFQGAYRMCKACVPLMIERGGGAIVGVGGLGSYRGEAARTHVMASKAGLGALMRGLAFDLGKYNIRANYVIVGHYDTEIEGSGSAKSVNVTDLSGIPLGRLGVPQDMADLIRFLVGPGSSYISGQTIHSNGGCFSPM